MSNIPKARLILREGLEGAPPHTKHVIRAALKEMTREPACRRAPERGEKFTPARKRAIKRYAADNPKETMLQIANHFNIRNTGRVSEILNGKR